MLSPFTIQQTRYGGLVYAKALGYLALGGDASESANFGHGIVSQFASHKGATGGISVKEVGKSGRPFEVVLTVVCSVKILVINLLQIVRVRNECFGNEPVNGSIANVISVPEVNANIAPVVYAGFHDASRVTPSRSCFSFQDAIRAADPSKVTDFVKSREFAKRYWPPFFHLVGAPARWITAVPIMAYSAIQCGG